MPMPPPAAERNEQLIYLPLWAEPLGDGTARGRGGPVGADAWWASVSPGATDRAPAAQTAEPRIRLQHFRLSTAPRSPGAPRQFVAVVRVQPFRPGSRPFLAIIESESAIQSGTWGRLLRRSGEAADFVFVLREPIPPPRPLANPALRRQIERPEINRRFDLRLALNPPSGSDGSGERAPR
jgi:hypothetical protein